MSPSQMTEIESTKTSSQDDLDLSMRSSSGNSTSTTNTALTSSPKGMKRSVSFSRLNVRHYERVLGDNPSCSSGPSISIGWKFKDAPSMDIDAYEFRRSRRAMLESGAAPRMMFSRMNRTLSLPDLSSQTSPSPVTNIPQKSHEAEDEEEDDVHQLATRLMYQSFRSAQQRCKILSREEREELLLGLGYSRSDIVDAIRENIRVKNQRRKTVNNLNVMKAEEILESITRGVKKGVCIRESGVGLYDEWIRH